MLIVPVPERPPLIVEHILRVAVLQVDRAIVGKVPLTVVASTRARQEAFHSPCC